MTRIYVVKVERTTESDNVYVGTDPQEAYEVSCDIRVEAPTFEKGVFIHVWEDGEHQFCTRENPCELDR